MKILCCFVMTAAVIKVPQLEFAAAAVVMSLTTMFGCTAECVRRQNYI